MRIKEYVVVYIEEAKSAAYSEGLNCKQARLVTYH